MSRRIKNHLISVFVDADKEDITNLVKKANEFKSAQLMFELQGFLEYYRNKYGDIKKSIDKVSSILDKFNNAKDIIFYGKGKNIDKIKLIEKEKNVYDRSEEDGTGLFKCKKCGKMNVSYRVDYRRSADEPPIITYRCKNPECGNTWVEG